MKRTETKIIKYYTHPFSVHRKQEGKPSHLARGWVWQGNVCYCNILSLPELLEHPEQLQNPFVLVTEGGDQMVTIEGANAYIGDAAFPRNHTIPLAKFPPTLTKWFGTVLNFHHGDNVEVCPIGTYDGYFNHLKNNEKGIENTFEQTFLLEKYRQLDTKKDILALMNFTKHGRYERFWLHNFAINKEWIVAEENHMKDYDEFLRQFVRAKFVFCPISNGIETARLWEAIYLGIIPIALNSVWIRNFLDLPILIVDNWEQVNPVFLENIWNDFQVKKDDFNYNKLNEQYWIDRIAAASREAAQKTSV